MILTRCPTCQTAFRVTPEQLRLRQGRVRCGSCGRAFNALETLLEERPDQQMAMAIPEEPPAEGADLPVLPTEKENNPTETEPSVPAPRPSRLFVLEEKPGTPFSGEFLLRDSFTPVTPDDSADLLIESFQRYRPAPSAAPWPSDKAESSQPEAAQPSDGRHESDPANAPDDTATDDTLSAPSDTSLTGQVETPAAEALADSTDGAQLESSPADWPELHTGIEESDAAPPDAPPAMPALLAERQEDIEAAPGEAPFDNRATTVIPSPEADTSDTHQDTDETIESAISGAGDDVETNVTSAEPGVDETDFELEPATRPRSWAWGLGIGVLGIAMLAQAALLFRQEVIQRMPQTRPLYAQLCSNIGCSMALPKDASKIAIESSDLHPESGVPNFFRLRATIRNRAAFEQAYPHLELTLTDSEDRPLARKVLAPSEWRPGDAPVGGFPAGSDLEVNLPFETKDIAAVGYRLYVFYP